MKVKFYFSSCLPHVLFPTILVLGVTVSNVVIIALLVIILLYLVYIRASDEISQDGSSIQEEVELSVNKTKPPSQITSSKVHENMEISMKESRDESSSDEGVGGLNTGDKSSGDSFEPIDRANATSAGITIKVDHVDKAPSSPGRTDSAQGLSVSSAPTANSEKDVEAEEDDVVGELKSPPSPRSPNVSSMEPPGLVSTESVPEPSLCSNDISLSSVPTNPEAQNTAQVEVSTEPVKQQAEISKESSDLVEGSENKTESVEGNVSNDPDSESTGPISFERGTSFMTKKSSDGNTAEALAVGMLDLVLSSSVAGNEAAQGYNNFEQVNPETPSDGSLSSTTLTPVPGVTPTALLVSNNSNSNLTSVEKNVSLPANDNSSSQSNLRSVSDDQLADVQSLQSFDSGSVMTIDSEPSVVSGGTTPGTGSKLYKARTSASNGRASNGTEVLPIFLILIRHI